MKKLLITFSIISLIISQLQAQNSRNSSQEAVIKAMLVQETKDSYALKFDEIGKAFIQSPQTFRAWNDRTGYDAQMGWQTIEASNKKDFGAKPREINPENENFTFRFYGDDACLVTYDQYLYGKEQKPSKEIRMLEKVDSKWKIAALVALWDYSPNKYEEDRIKKVIQTETDGYHTGNVKLMVAQYSDKMNNECQRMDLVALGGKPFAKGQDLVKIQDVLSENLKPTGMTSTNSDYEVRMSGTMAWVTYSQETTKPNSDLRPIKNREVRVLERIDGNWKIVFIGGVDVK